MSGKKEIKEVVVITRLIKRSVSFKNYLKLLDAGPLMKELLASSDDTVFTRIDKTVKILKERGVIDPDYGYSEPCVNMDNISYTSRSGNTKVYFTPSDKTPPWKVSKKTIGDLEAIITIVYHVSDKTIESVNLGYLANRIIKEGFYCPDVTMGVDSEHIDTELTVDNLSNLTRYALADSPITTPVSVALRTNDIFKYVTCSDVLNAYNTGFISKEVLNSAGLDYLEDKLITCNNELIDVVTKKPVSWNILDCYYNYEAKMNLNTRFFREVLKHPEAIAIISPYKTIGDTSNWLSKNHLK